jgi:hypothetical protein
MAFGKSNSASTPTTFTRSTDLISWTDTSASVNGTGEVMILSDTKAPPNQAFYRVRADNLDDPNQKNHTLKSL